MLISRLNVEELDPYEGGVSSVGGHSDVWEGLLRGQSSPVLPKESPKRSQATVRLESMGQDDCH